MAQGVLFGHHARPCRQVSPLPSWRKMIKVRSPSHRHPAILEVGLGLARNGQVCSFPSDSPCYIRVANWTLWNVSPLLSPAEGHRRERSGEHKLFLTFLHLGNRDMVNQGTALTYRMYFTQPFRFRKLTTEPSHLRIRCQLLIPPTSDRRRALHGSTEATSHHYFTA